MFDNVVFDELIAQMRAFTAETKKASTSTTTAPDIVVRAGTRMCVRRSGFGSSEKS
jgi:hypothetical protein